MCSGDASETGATERAGGEGYRSVWAADGVTDGAVVVACLASIVAVVVALTQSSSQDPDAASVALIILGVLATMVAWALVNTVYALKYARLYFVDHGEDGLD